jgi:probable F420-dependent oxidoreductase
VTRFSVPVPQLAGDDVKTYAHRAEELGFDGFWALDSAVAGRTAHSRGMLDGLNLLAFLAAVTSKATLGMAVIVLPRRNPALIAKELATVDQLSGGRLIAGVGLGRSDGSEGALGFPTDRHVRRMTETVEMMRAFWSQEEASFDGELFQFSRVHVEPKPAQDSLPIWFGGAHPNAIRRAARLADGWIGAGSQATSAVLEQIVLLREELERRGRDASTFPIAKRVYIAVEDDEQTARDKLTPILDGMYGAPGLTERVAVYGTAEQVAEGLRPLLDAGAGELLLHPLYELSEQLEAAAEVRRLLSG